MNIVRGWASRINYDRFDVTLAHHSPQPEELRRRLAEFPRLRVVHLPALGSLRALYLPGIRALVQLMRRERFDLVHTIFIQADILGAVAAGLSGVPVVVSSAMGHLIGQMQGSPSAQRAKRIIYKAGYRLVRRRIARHFTITRTTGRQLESEFGVSPGKLQVIYSGVELATRVRPARAPDSFLLGSAGQLIPPKGVRTLIEALPQVIARVPPARVVIAGEGPEQPALARRAAELGVADRVEFIGFCEDVPALMARLDAFVFPSFPSYDGLPRVILEAMVQRTPVIAARTDPIEEVVQEGATGWLFAPGDAAGLAAAILRLRGDAPGARELVERAHRQVQDFSIEHEVAQMQEAYGSLLEQAHAQR